MPPTPTPGEGWQVYINGAYGYQFSYPVDATITEIGVESFPADDLPEGMTPDEYLAQLRETYPDNLCVGVQYELGYINISAPPNRGFRYALCGRTGVGAGEMVDKSETVVMGEQTYTAAGFEFIGAWEPCETLDCHNETLVIELADGTRIEYGAAPSETATYEDYLKSAKAVLLQILASYETLAVPAITIVGTVMDVALSARVIMLVEPAEGFSIVALTEASELVAADGSEATLQDIQRGMLIQASGRPGESDALLADQVLVLEATPTSTPD